ncbi:MAG: type II toxin-antitoxin system VapC family toxin [Pyrinomonadaceae bacterium]
MNLLLDTHVFMWMHEDAKRLSQKAADSITDPANALFLSVVSVWEMQIKIKLGKFSFSDKLAEVISMQQEVNSVRILPLDLSHALYLENLELHHKDPFDRLLISQALVENLTIVTVDQDFPKYGVNILW